MFFLTKRDPELHALIAGVQDEELWHLNHAAANIRSRNTVTRAADVAIGAVTDVLIVLSTWSDSVRMAHDLARHRTAVGRNAAASRRVAN